MKSTTSYLSVSLTLTLSFATGVSQTDQRPPTQPASATSAQDDDVVRITSNLVQVDAVVTDKKGQPVNDLRAEDFVVSVDGKRQNITNFSFINTESAITVAPTPEKSKSRKVSPIVPPIRLKPEQVRRTIALVVDDLGTSFESTHSVRQALMKFVDQQMRPDDLVAIIRTSAGVGALQQFTSDKRMLYAAIERVRWTPGRSGISAFAPLESDPIARSRSEVQSQTGRNVSDDAANERDVNGEIQDFREEIFSIGTLGALNFVIRGLRDLPGRKSVILFSDGFNIYRREDNTFNDRILESLRRLTDLANRASVVIYTVDARGLQTLGLTAADDTSGMSLQQIEQSMSDRRAQFFDTQSGMNYLAQQTGGFFVKNSNDLSGGVRKVLEDQKGYYLIGFKPDHEIFDLQRGRARFKKLEVKLTRPDLKLRTRHGFYGISEEDAKPVRKTRNEQMMAALTSPFKSGEIPLILTSIYTNEGPKADILTSLVHIDVSKLHFEDEPDGWQKIVFEVVVVTFGADGKIIQDLDRTETVRARAESLELVKKGGLVYTLRVPIKKSGAYQLRVAVRDPATSQIGSASQFVEIPDISKKRLTLSGLVMQGSSKPLVRLAQAADPSPKEGQQIERDLQSHAAVRKFPQGTSADFAYSIYNAKRDPTGKPHLSTQFVILRDGNVLHRGAATPYTKTVPPGQTQITLGTRIRFNQSIPPGEYVLQVFVTDELAREKHRFATQWIEFEVQPPK